MNDAISSKQMLNQMIVGSWITQGIYVAAQLGIADMLADGSQTVEQLARQTNTHPEALYRLLRALAGMGIFCVDANGRFILTPMAEHLRSDDKSCMRSFAIMMGTEFYETWGKLLHSVQTGEQGFAARYGKSVFEYLTEHPDRHSIFDSAMTGVHDPETQPMVDAYDFSCFSTVVDIGGGNGSMLKGILERYPSVKGIVFDLPQVAEGCKTMIRDSCLSKRCQFVGGNFFESVPAGVDVYVMRHVLHDWQDDQAVEILRRCREAMNPNSRILVVEMVIPPGNEPFFGKWLDLMMLLVGGRERTEQQYAELFATAGLKLNRVVPTSSEVSVVEAVAGDD